MTKPIADRALSRRAILRASLANLTACEMTGLPSAWAEGNFTMGSTGGTWGAGIRKSFIEIPHFAEAQKIRPSYLDAPTAVLISRLLAQPASPPFTVADLLDVEHFM